MAGPDLLRAALIEALRPRGGDFTVGEIGGGEASLVLMNLGEDLRLPVQTRPVGVGKLQTEVGSQDFEASIRQL